MAYEKFYIDVFFLFSLLKNVKKYFCVLLFYDEGNVLRSNIIDKGEESVQLSVSSYIIKYLYQRIIVLEIVCSINLLSV